MMAKSDENEDQDMKAHSEFFLVAHLGAEKEARMLKLMLQFVAGKGRFLLQRLFKCWWEERKRAKAERAAAEKEAKIQRLMLLFVGGLDRCLLQRSLTGWWDEVRQAKEERNQTKTLSCLNQRAVSTGRRCTSTHG